MARYITWIMSFCKVCSLKSAAREVGKYNLEGQIQGQDGPADKYIAMCQ
jgi:hypothetical protein